jgi:hypothetical protein
VDDFFEKVEKNSDNGSKLVSWHGELVFLPCDGIDDSTLSFIVGHILLKHIPKDQIGIQR